MILYTPLAYQDIFPQEQMHTDAIQAIEWNGKTIYLSKKSDGNYQIEQLLSTDPNDYLSPDFSPGRIIT